jgi:serine/threonine-protein kinase
MGLEAGHRIGAYEIVGLLGAGGMGEVYRARDTRLGRRVAIKIISKEFATDPTAAARLDREALLTSSLNHPNIVTVHDVGEENGQPYIVMEFVEGQSLHALLSSGRLKPSRAIEIASQVAEGLASAHAAGVVHRDLKPHNIMVTDDGRAKIVDFGVGKLHATAAHAEDVTTLAADLTSPHVIPGTVGYMSPEQVSGDPIDFRTDQFALGAIVYEMLTGQRAFKRNTRVQTMAAVVESEPPSIAQLSPDTPEDVVRIVERCLAKPPAHRYASTQDLARDLREVGARPAGSGSTAIVRRVGDRRPGRWTVAGAAVAVVAAVALAVVFLLPRSSVLDDARTLLGRYDRLDNVDRALVLLESSAAARASDPAHQTALAEAYWRRFEHTRDRSLIDRAAAAASASLKLDAGYAPTHVVLALLNNGQSRFDGATGEAKQAIALDPRDGRAWRELGRAQSGLGRTDEARRAFLEAVALAPQDWTVHNHLGGFYFSVNELDAAAKSFQRVLDLAPDNTRGYNNLGSVSLRLERFDHAAEMYERSLSLDKNATAFANLGLAYYEQGLYADAARSYEGAVALPRPTYQLWANLGAACYWAPGLRPRAQVAYETAIAMGREAREVTPKNASVLAALASAHASLASLADAPSAAPHASEARQLIATLESLPTTSDDMFTVASTFEVLGDRTKALEWLARSVKAGYRVRTVERSPFLKELRNDPGYVSAIR